MLYVQHIEANLIHKPLNTDQHTIPTRCMFRCPNSELIQMIHTQTINSKANSNNEQNNCINNYWKFENKKQ